MLSALFGSFVAVARPLLLLGLLVVALRSLHWYLRTKRGR